MKAKSLRRNARQLGFTLIELLITVTIVGILAAIAVPSYTNYIRRGQIEEATAALSSGRVALEQYFLDNRKYTGGPCPVATSHFTMECRLGDATYVVKATGNGASSGFEYTIDEKNARTTAGPWGSGACWIDRKGGSC
jgi:type IV pilus assembly protein PilE